MSRRLLFALALLCTGILAAGTVDAPPAPAARGLTESFAQFSQLLQDASVDVRDHAARPVPAVQRRNGTTVDVWLEEHPIQRITLHGIAAAGEPLRIDSWESADALQAYAIDPTALSFSNGTIVATAKGTALQKCKDWNFTARACMGTWEFVQGISPGQRYTIALTPDDPAFRETSAAVALALAPINLSTFVLAWVDNASSSLRFQVLDINNTVLVNDTVVDATVDAVSRVSLAAINGTHFVIAWVDGPDDDVTYAIFNVNGSTELAATDAGLNVGTNTDISVAEFGGRFSFCYANDTDDDAEYQVFFNNGSRAVNELNVDTNMAPTLTLQNLIECTGMNASRWVYAWFDDSTNDVVFSILNNTGVVVAGPTSIDAAAGETAQVATASLSADSTVDRFIVVYYDAADADVTVAIRDINGNQVLASTDIDTTAGTESRVAVTAIRSAQSANDDAVVVWYNQSSDRIMAAVLDRDGGIVTAPFTVESAPNGAFRLMDVAAKDAVTNNQICQGRFVVAYTNATGQGVYRRFLLNGSEWDGSCPADVTGPLLTNTLPLNGTLFSPQPSTIEVAIDAVDTSGTDVVRANITFPNGTVQALTLSAAGGNKFNASFTVPALSGRFDIFYFANDTLDNRANSSTFFLISGPIRGTFVQRGDLSGTTANLSVGISGVNAARAFVLFQAGSANSNPEDGQFTSNLTGTTAVFAKYSSGTVSDLRWQVVTGPSLSVQRGTEFLVVGQATVNVTIAAVNLNSTFVIVDGRCNSAAAADYPAGLFLGNLTNATRLELVRGNEGDCAAAVSWQVVEWENARVISGSTVIPSAVDSATVSGIPAVNLSRTFLIFGSASTGTDTGVDTNLIQENISSQTSLSFTKSPGNVDPNTERLVAWYAVELPGAVRAQSGFVSFSTDVVVSIDSVARGRSFHVGSPGWNNGGGTGFRNAQYRINLTNSTTLLIDKESTVNLQNIVWQLMELPSLNVSAINLSPAAGNAFLINGTVNLTVNATAEDIVQSVSMNITLPNGTVEQVLLFNATANIFNFTWLNLTLRGRYNVTYVAQDRAGTINATATTFFVRRALDVVDVRMRLADDPGVENGTESSAFANYSVTVLANASGMLNLSVSVNGSRVRTINVTRHDENSVSSIIRIDDWEPGAGRVTGAASYGIDLGGFNFTNATFTVNASGTRLRKCADWNFTGRDCLGTFEDLLNLTPGQLYTFALQNSTDPGFAETTPSVDVAVAPFDNTTFVLAFIRNDTNALEVQVWNTNGSLIANATVDATVDGDSRVDVVAKNSTHFVIAWVDGPEDDVTMQMFYRNGTNSTGAIDVDTAVGLFTDVSVTDIVDRHPVCYADDVDNDATFQVFNNSNGSTVVGETDVDVNLAPSATVQNLIDCAGVNRTRFVVFWFDDADNDATYSRRNETGGALGADVDIDAAVGETAQVAVSAVDNDKFAMVWFDASDDDVTIAVRGIEDNVILAPTDIDTEPGTESRVAVAAVRRNATALSDSFVVVWQNQSSNRIMATVRNETAGVLTAPFTVDTAANSAFRLLDVAARDPVSGNALCPGFFVVAYSNSTNQSVFRGFNVNGSPWDGSCAAVADVDIFVNASEIDFNVSHPRENQNITINATIRNIGSATATSVLVMFWDNTTTGKPFQIDGNITIASIPGGAAVVVNVTYVTIIGNRTILVTADPLNTITETNETNNNATRQLNVQAWTIFFGNSRANLTLDATLENRSHFTWNHSDAGFVYFFDTDSNFNVTALQALGRNTTNGTAVNDFGEADVNLNMTGFNDSIVVLWTGNNNSTANETRNLTIFGRLVGQVPTLNSTNAGTFVTGILWDTGDDTNGQYDIADKEDLIFVGNINLSKTGASGNLIDYEVRVPTLLRQYRPPNNQSAFITELR